ncbi:MAG: serine/threonine-protein kinase [Kofleriaceae bacterium]
MTVVLAGKYHLQRRLGIGGMAEVYLANRVGAEGFAQPVAIKRVLKGFANDDRFVAMFLAEAKLSARLDHQNIVRVFELARDDDGRPFLVMEVVDGPTLDALLGTGQLPFPAIIFLVGEILRGLAYAHDLPVDDDGVLGLVHRDVSPHNVLLSWQGEVKLSDFGIAKVRMASNATASEMIKGKPAYMSPEQANAEALDGRSDLFAVGVILWEMLAGRPLFSGGTTQETFAKLMFAEIPPPSRLRQSVPAELGDVTIRWLARERADRDPTLRPRSPRWLPVETSRRGRRRRGAAGEPVPRVEAAATADGPTARPRGQTYERATPAGIDPLPGCGPARSGDGDHRAGWLEPVTAGRDPGPRTRCPGR